MGFKDIMVEPGHNHLLITAAYHRLLETMNDDMIEWSANVISREGVEGKERNYTTTP
jgi:hypothetical protein